MWNIATVFGLTWAFESDRPLSHWPGGQLYFLLREVPFLERRENAGVDCLHCHYDSM
jgi:hypothetical protein